MFFGIDVQVLASATALSSMLAARREAPSHVPRGQLGAGGGGCGGQAVRPQRSVWGGRARPRAAWSVHC